MILCEIWAQTIGLQLYYSYVLFGSYSFHADTNKLLLNTKHKWTKIYGH